MDINAPLIVNERAIYSENLLNKESLFDDDTVFNVTSGSGTVTITNEKHYENDKCAKIVWTDIENPLTFYSAGDTYTAEYDGTHFFSWALYVFSNNPTMTPTFLLRIKAYKNAVLYKEFTSSCSPAENETYQDNVFQRFGQSLELEQGDVLTWSYECVYGQYLLGTITVYLDGLKLELDDRNLGVPSVYSKPKYYCCGEKLFHVSETQWDVADIGTQTIANGASLNLFSLINNVTHKNLTNSDTYDQLNIVSNSIKTTYRGCKIIHLVRISINITSGTDQHYQLQIRRTVDDSVVYRAMMERNADETTQTIEMTTRTLSETDPFVIDGFYLAFVNNSGASCSIDDALSLVVISTYQQGQKV